MLDTNKDTTGKTSIHFYGQFITESVRHGRFTTQIFLVKHTCCTDSVRSDQFQIIACLVFLAWKLQLALIPNQTKTRLEHQLSSSQTRNLNKQFGDFNFPPDGFSFFTEELRIKTFVSTFRNYFRNLENSNFLGKFFWTNKNFALQLQICQKKAGLSFKSNILREGKYLRRKKYLEGI